LEIIPCLQQTVFLKDLLMVIEIRKVRKIGASDIVASNVNDTFDVVTVETDIAKMQNYTFAS
jgi:hypothetical protein